MKVFVDTNILLDFLCKREPFREDAEKLFLLGIRHKVDIILCGLSIVNTIYTSKKYGVTREQCVSSLKGLLTFCDISNIDKHTLQNALGSDWKDLEDAVQFFSVKGNDIDFIITRDKKGFSDSTIPVLDTSSFVRSFNAYKL